MEEIKLYIISTDKNDDYTNNKKRLDINNNNELGKANTLEELKYEYKIWIKDLLKLMSSCSYRKVLGEIEKNKINFESLDKEDLIKYKLIKLKAIFKIISKKFDKYKSEIKRENSHQNKAIKFWFNESFYIFEDIYNDLDPEKNTKINIYSINIIKPMKRIIEKYLELIYLLIIFHKELNEIAQICIYLSFTDKFMPYITYLTDFKSIYIFQKLLLLRAKIYLENRNYAISLEYQKSVIKLCFRIFLLITDVYKGLDNIDEQISIKASYTKKIYNTFVNMLLAFYLRGVTCEHLGNIKRASRAYIMCKWIYLRFLLDDNELFGLFLSKIENNTISQIQIIKDIQETYKKKKALANKRKSIKILKNVKRVSSQENIKSSYNVKYPFIMDKNQNLTSKQNKNENKSLNTNANNTEMYKKEQLEHYLDKIGEKLYKEEENRNNNLIKNFTKSSYIVSTMTMINNLLSKDFKDVILKMKKIEITKPKEEINSLINKTIIEKRRRLFNSNLAKSRRVNSAMNINKNYYEYDNNNTLKSFKKNSINNNIRRKIKFYSNKRKKNYNINTSISANNNNNPNRYYNYYNMNNQDNYKISTNQETIKINKRANSINTSERKEIIPYIKKNLSCPDINTNTFTKYSFKRKKIRKIKNLSTSEKVIKYPIDKHEFSKNYLKKKNYIDKYFDKEIDFNKRLLNSKIYEIKKISSNDLFNPKKSKYLAEREYDLIYNVQKSKLDQKDMSDILNIKRFKILNELSKKETKKEEDNDLNTLKIDRDLVSSRKKRQRRLGIVEINRKKMIWLNNEEKMKKLSAECDEISHRQKKIQKQRRNILVKIGNKK